MTRLAGMCIADIKSPAAQGYYPFGWIFAQADTPKTPTRPKAEGEESFQQLLTSTGILSAVIDKGSDEQR
jgi:hypothetical protein